MKYPLNMSFDETKIKFRLQLEEGFFKAFLFFETNFKVPRLCLEVKSLAMPNNSNLLGDIYLRLV